MYPNATFRRALVSLSHPISVAAIVILLLNDHVLRRMSPSWLTGKIGDFAWLIFAPFLLAALLAWLLPKREALVGRVSIMGAGAIFALAKTVPAFHAITIKVLETLTGWPSALRMDPTDLIALPVLLIVWWIWQQSVNRAIALPHRGWVLLPLAALATMANLPPLSPFGVRQIAEVNSTLYTQDFQSDDGGLTWHEGGKKDVQSYGNVQPWLLSDPADVLIQYRITPGVEIERSDDGGQTWCREFDLSGEEARVASITPGWNIQPGPFDAIIHQATGNLVVAMGREGVLVRLPSGEWRWVSVGSFTAPQLNRVDRIAALLLGEIWSGVALMALVAGTILLVRQLNLKRKNIPVVLLVIVAWGAWLVTLIAFRPALARDFDRLITPVAAGFALLIGVICAVVVGRRQRRAVAPTLRIALIALLLFLLPYVLWTQGAIPFYGTATFYALALTTATLTAGFFYVRRLDAAPPPTITTDQTSANESGESGGAE